MPKDYKIQCRGLPWECNEQQLRNFFGDTDIEDLDIATRNGRASGDATVTFTNEDDYKKALKKDREHMGSRYIEVFPFDSVPRRRGDRDDFRSRGGPARDRYSDRGGSRASGPDYVVRLRGLPFSVTTRDINDFLAPLPIVRDGILLPDQHRARPGGEAYVCFENMESVQIAKQRHMKNIGHRYIEVFEASYRELSRFADENGLRVPRFGPSPFVSAPTGPPRGAYDPYAQQDNYRSGSGGGTNSMYRQSEPEDPYGRSRPSANDYGSRSSFDSYPQTTQPYGSAHPASQQQPSMGYYESYAPKPSYEAYGRERGPDPRDSRGPIDPRDARDMPRDTRDAPREPRMTDSRSADPRSGVPVDPYVGESRYPEYGYESRDSFWRGGAGGPPVHGGGGGAGAPSAPTGRDPYPVGDSWASGGGPAGPPSTERDRYGSGSYMSEPYGEREAGGALRRSEYERPNDRYSKPEPYGYGRERDYGGHSAPQNQQFILRMRGVPFRATEADVYDFFHPIRPNQVDLLRDHQYQRPSGDARVIFYSRKDYDDALMKDKQYMGERYIEMIPDNGRY